MDMLSYCLNGGGEANLAIMLKEVGKHHLIHQVI